MVAALEPHLVAGPVRGGHLDLVGRAHPRDRRAAGGARDRLRRCARRPHPRGRRARRTLHHGGRHRCGVRPYPPGARDDGHRRDALRPDRLRPGGQDPQQHAGVPAYSGSGRGDRDRPAQRRAARGAAADHRQGLRRQLRAAQPRHEVHAAARLPGARLLHALCDQGPVLRAGDGGGGGPGGAGGGTHHAAPAAVRAGGQWRSSTTRPCCG